MKILILPENDNAKKFYVIGVLKLNSSRMAILILPEKKEEW